MATASLEIHNQHRGASSGAYHSLDVRGDASHGRLHIRRRPCGYMPRVVLLPHRQRCLCETMVPKCEKPSGSESGGSEHSIQRCACRAFSCSNTHQMLVGVH